MFLPRAHLFHQKLHFILLSTYLSISSTFLEITNIIELEHKLQQFQIYFLCEDNIDDKVKITLLAMTPNCLMTER